MRDSRFVAVHRGGSLIIEHHRLLIKWAVMCSGNVLFLAGSRPDARLTHALTIAIEWAEGRASVGEARKASVGAIRVANEVSDNVAIAVARSVGHAVATAHMADHSLGAALYGKKAVYAAGRSVEDEGRWQTDQIPDEIRELVLSGLREKEKHFKIKQ